MSKPLQKLERPPSLHHSVQEAIKNYIVDNDLQPTSALPPETELARLLGVSRNSVREAVKALQTTGILESRRGSGLFVGTFSFDSLLDNLPYGLLKDIRELSDLLEIRQVLETGLIDAAVERMSPSQLEGLYGVLEKMKHHAERGRRFPDEDRAFHRLLFLTLDNALLLKLLDIFWLAFRKASQQVDIDDPDPLATYQNHVTIFENVKEGDVTGAREALAQHYESIRQRLQKLQGER